MNTNRSRPGADDTEATVRRGRTTSKPTRLAKHRRPSTGHHGPIRRDDQPNQPIDWTTFLSATPPPPDWLLFPILERGQHALLFSETKAGKSLLTLDLVKRACEGCQLDGTRTRPLRVLYLDYENADVDLHLRLHALEVTAEQLEGLVYIQFPELPPLDTPAGGRELLALARRHDVELVVIDTISRALEGLENDSATAHNFYRHSLVDLKRNGIASLRLDHSGKDQALGARGSSAKNSDVDAAWNLKFEERKRQRLLHRTYTRRGRGPEQVALDVQDSPLLHVLRGTSGDIAPDAEAICAVLDQLQVPSGSGRPAVRNALRKAGYTASTKTLQEAVKLRKSTPENPDPMPGQSTT